MLPSTGGEAADRTAAPARRVRAGAGPRASGAIRSRPAPVELDWRGAWSPPAGEKAAAVAKLPALQRLLLTTDGTVTSALATLLDEPIAVRMLGQQLVLLHEDDAELSVAAGSEVLERRVVLHGVDSGTPLLYGESRIVTDRLSPAVRAALIAGDVAIGLVVRAHQLETFRAPLCLGIGSATEHAVRYLAPGLICWRRYLINAGGQPLMMVCEQFPADGFATAR